MPISAIPMKQTFNRGTICHSQKGREIQGKKRSMQQELKILRISVQKCSLPTQISSRGKIQNRNWKRLINAAQPEQAMTFA